MTSLLADPMQLAADLADLDGNARLIRTAPLVVVAMKPHECCACFRAIQRYEPHATKLWMSKRTRVRRRFCLACAPRWMPDARPLVDRRALLAASKMLAGARRIEDLSPACVAFVGALLAKAAGVPF